MRSMFPPLIAYAHSDGPRHVRIAIGPDDDIRAEPLVHRATALLRQAVAADVISGPSEPSSDIGLWQFDAETPRAEEVVNLMRSFLGSQGCVVRPDRSVEPGLRG